MKKISFLLIPVLLSNLVFSSNPPTANDIIQLIKNRVNCEWSEKTVDTFKSGNPDDEVTGIVSCMFADLKVLQEAVKKNCNLIITHEPVFYNHLDDTDKMKDDPVLKDKLAYIKKHKLIIWRFHDHWHRHQPDGIYQGMLNRLGWSDQRIGGNWSLVNIEKQNLANLASFLKKKLHAVGIRVIGNPDMEVENVSLALGAPGSAHHFSKFNTQDFEVMIAGEAPEWETYQYVNDAVAQEKEKAIIFLGHIPSEEAGMEFFASWLKESGVDTSIYFIANSSPYWIVN